MLVSPVFANRSINSILVASEIILFSFCSPSRAPTSTILTRLSDDVCARLAVANPLCTYSGAERLHARQMDERSKDMVNYGVWRNAT